MYRTPGMHPVTQESIFTLYISQVSAAEPAGTLNTLLTSPSWGNILRRLRQVDQTERQQNLVTNDFYSQKSGFVCFYQSSGRKLMELTVLSAYGDEAYRNISKNDKVIMFITHIR